MKKTHKYRKKNKRTRLKSHRGGVIECDGIEENKYESNLLNLPISLIHIIGEKCIDEKNSLFTLSETCQKLYCIYHQQEEGDINLMQKQKITYDNYGYDICEDFIDIQDVDWEGLTSENFDWYHGAELFMDLPQIICCSEVSQKVPLIKERLILWKQYLYSRGQNQADKIIKIILEEPTRINEIISDFIDYIDLWKEYLLSQEDVKEDKITILEKPNRFNEILSNFTKKYIDELEEEEFDY